MAERRTLPKQSSTPQKKKSAPKAPLKKTSPVAGEAWAIVVIAFGVLFALSFYTSGTGVMGAALRSFGLGLFGVLAYTLPVILVVFGIFKLIRKRIKMSSLWLVFGIFVSMCAFVHLCSAVSEAPVKELYSWGRLGDGGGLFGGLIVKALSFTGGLGTGVILATVIIVLVIFLTGFSVSDFIAETGERIRQARLDREEEEFFEDKKEVKAEPRRREKPEPAARKVMEKEPEPEFKIFTHDQMTMSEPPKEEKLTAEEIMQAEKESTEQAKEIAEPVPEAEIEEEIEKTKTVIEYEYPPIDLLTEKPRSSKSKEKPEDLRESAKKLIDTLKSFGVEAKVLEVSRGPSVTRFEIQPSAGVKVSKIVNLADDIALNLAAFGVRIEAPIPGKAAVGIEIPNKSVSAVSLREVISSPEFKEFDSDTAFAIGKDISGNPIISDISKMPHLLIAGTTGSGKSVCINTLITSLIYKSSPNEVRLLMIDPKVVELKLYNGIPHLLIPVVTDPRKAAGALNWAVTEMTRRYKMFADYNVRDIRGFNEYAQTEGLDRLETIVIIIDELSDLMMVAPHDVEDAICRLAQMARAAGMHLVIATQRPSVDVITGLIKANVPSRIAFKVSNQIDSRTILDMMGAEKLLGRGDMLFLPVGASKPTRIQGAFITDKEVESIVDFIKGDRDAVYDEDIIDRIENGEREDKEEEGGECDEFLNQAIEIVVDSGQASVSLIQRKLKVGYARAGRIIDQMETRGIIGPHEGSKPRQVLLTRAQFYEMMMHKDEGGEEDDQ